MNMDQMIELCAKTNDPYEQINKARKMKKSSTTKVVYEERFIWDYNDESQEKVKKIIDTFDANMGGTEIL